MAAPDVEDLVVAGCNGVDPTEERGHPGVGRERGEAFGPDAAQGLTGQGVDAVVGDGGRHLLHVFQGFVGLTEGRAFDGEDVTVFPVLRRVNRRAVHRCEITPRSRSAGREM